jgi:hypothetical protein
VDQGIADYRPSWIPAGVAADLIKLPAVEVQRAAWNRLDLEHQLQGIAAAKAAHLLFGSADNGLYRALRHRLSPKEACELRHLINMVKTRKVLTPQERLEVWSRVQWMLAEHLEVDQACQEQEAADRQRGRQRGGSGGTATLTCFSTRTRSNAIPHATVSQGAPPTAADKAVAAAPARRSSTRVVDVMPTSGRPTAADSARRIQPAHHGTAGVLAHPAAAMLSAKMQPTNISRPGIRKPASEQAWQLSTALAAGVDAANLTMMQVHRAVAPNQTAALHLDEQWCSMRASAAASLRS